MALQSWPGGLEIKVRMGLHTGEAQVTGEGYVGMVYIAPPVSVQPVMADSSWSLNQPQL